MLNYLKRKIMNIFMNVNAYIFGRIFWGSKEILLLKNKKSFNSAIGNADMNHIKHQNIANFLYGMIK
jgi:hypothetical protein